MNGSSPSDRTVRIRDLNDAFRRTFAGGKVVMSRSVADLPPMVTANVLVEVARYNRFTPDNDPYGEHDFGSFVFCGRTLFWKIEYYDPSMEAGSEDPANVNKTTRVLTVMLAEDY
jgi:hypothetical protein